MVTQRAAIVPAASICAGTRALFGSPGYTGRR